MNRHLWLIGMMGSGKTTAARRIASRWGEKWVDTDAQVSRSTQYSIAQIWADSGEKAFRQMEALELKVVAEGPPSVVATGGGIVLDPQNVQKMRETGVVVWLSALPETLSKRVMQNTSRPLLADDASSDRLAKILDARHSLYEAAAHCVVETDELDVVEVIDRIEAVWNEF